MTSKIEIDESENPALGQELIRRLVDHNLAQVPPSNRQPFLLYVQAEQKLIAGLQGHTHWGWMFIAHFWVDQGHRHRGLGSRLLTRAEDLARTRGCHNVWLDTFSLQAMEFYRKNGYKIFGQLPDFPAGCVRFFLFKPV